MKSPMSTAGNLPEDRAGPEAELGPARRDGRRGAAGVAGSGAAANAMVMGSAAGGATAQLSFSREMKCRPLSSDSSFSRCRLRHAEGLLRCDKIRSKQWFSKEQVPLHDMTHPAIEDRMAYVTSWIEDHKDGTPPTLKLNRRNSSGSGPA